MTGLEQLLAMAAADGRFAAALLEDRDGAVEASGLKLSLAQQRMLDGVDEAGLRSMILGLAGSGTDERRRLFLAQAAVALAALAGVAGCRPGEEKPAETPTPARQEKPTPPPKPEVQEEPAEAEVQPLEGLKGAEPPGVIGQGSLDTVGTGIRPSEHGVRTLGSGGYTGSRPGQIHGRLGERPPDRVKAAHLKVKGGLEKEIVRRINRRHANELRYCYGKELQKKPDLAGTVEVTYTISLTGQVRAAALGPSTTGNAELDRCVVKAVKRWLYPKPKGELAQVTAKWMFWVEKRKKKGKRKKGKGKR